MNTPPLQPVQVQCEFCGNGLISPRLISEGTEKQEAFRAVSGSPRRPVRQRWPEQLRFINSLRFPFTTRE